MKTLQVKVIGKVQGVWFRASTKKKADELGLTGFVCNESDGSVYIVASGTADKLDDLIVWCHQGPTYARVDRVEVGETEGGGYQGFVIRRWLDEKSKSI